MFALFSVRAVVPPGRLRLRFPCRSFFRIGLRLRSLDQSRGGFKVVFFFQCDVSLAGGFGGHGMRPAQRTPVVEVFDNDGGVAGDLECG